MRCLVGCSTRERASPCSGPLRACRGRGGGQADRGHDASPRARRYNLPSFVACMKRLAASPPLRHEAGRGPAACPVVWSGLVAVVCSPAVGCPRRQLRQQQRWCWSTTGLRAGGEHMELGCQKRAERALCAAAGGSAGRRAAWLACLGWVGGLMYSGFLDGAFQRRVQAVVPGTARHAVPGKAGECSPPHGSVVQSHLAAAHPQKR